MLNAKSPMCGRLHRVWTPCPRVTCRLVTGRAQVLRHPPRFSSPVRDVVRERHHAGHAITEKWHTRQLQKSSSTHSGACPRLNGKSSSSCWRRMHSMTKTSATRNCLATFQLTNSPRKKQASTLRSRCRRFAATWQAASFSQVRRSDAVICVPYPTSRVSERRDQPPRADGPTSLYDSADARRPWVRNGLSGDQQNDRTLVVRGDVFKIALAADVAVNQVLDDQRLANGSIGHFL